MMLVNATPVLLPPLSHTEIVRVQEPEKRQLRGRSESACGAEGVAVQSAWGVQTSALRFRYATPWRGKPAATSGARHGVPLQT
jgi:hypothetical protein